MDSEVVVNQLNPFYWEDLIKSTSKIMLEESNVSNFVISPLGLAMTIFMMTTTHSGPAAKETFAALRMYDNTDINYVHLFFNKVKKHYDKRRSKNSPDMLVKNFFLTRFPQITVKKDYLSMLKLYRADVEDVNFQEDGMRVMNKINKLVARKTNNQIKTLMEAPAPSDAMVEAFNIVSLKSDWQTEFQDIGNKTFHSPHGDIQTEFIEAKGTFGVTKFLHSSIHRTLVWIALPTKGNITTCLLFPEKESVSLSDMLNVSNIISSLKQTIDSLKNPHLNTRMKLQIPKIRIQKEIDVTEVMRKLGAPHSYATDLESMVEVPHAIPASLELKSRRYTQRAATVIDSSKIRVGAVANGETEYAPRLFGRRKRQINDPEKKVEVFTVDRPFFLFTYDMYLDVPIQVSAVVRPEY